MQHIVACDTERRKTAFSDPCRSEANSAVTSIGAGRVVHPKEPFLLRHLPGLWERLESGKAIGMDDIAGLKRFRQSKDDQDVLRIVRLNHFS